MPIQKQAKNLDNTAILQSETVGTASYLFPDTIFFFKGPSYVAISQIGGQSDPKLPLARALADSLPAGEPDIPPLVKHLPDHANPDEVVRYAVNSETLALIAPNQPVLQSVGFEGGTEVAAAEYGKSQLLIAEFSTPQLATMNNWNIEAKIEELRGQGQPAPTAYRRVGNYGVFVFNAPMNRPATRSSIR